MTVKPLEARDENEGAVRLTEQQMEEGYKMKNNWLTTGIAILIWLIITVMNVANLVLLGKGA